MAAVVINGDTSGSVTLQAPAVAGSTTITLPSTSGTLASIASVNNNGVVYANSSGQPTTSTGFVFDGANVGIGTSSPANKLQVYQNASAAVMAVQNQTTSLQIQVNDGVATGAGVIYQTGAYPLTLWTNTSERMRIDSSGNVGIGTSSPAYKLHVLSADGVTTSINAAATGRIRAFGYIDATRGALLDSINTAENTYLPFTINGSVVQFQTGATERMRIDSSGNVGIGMTPTNFGNGYTVLQVANATNGGMLYLTTTANAGGRIYGNGAGITYDAFSTTYHAFITNSSERMRLDSSGNLLVGNTSNVSTGRVEITRNGERCLTLNNSATGTAANEILNFIRNGAQVGNINTTNTTTAYVTSSDYRLKENVQPMTGALAKVSALKPVIYKWKADGSDGEGFIAHELAEVCPHAVTGEKDAVNEDGSIKPQGIDTSFLVATLTAAIQEMKQIVDAQAAEIAQLKGAQQ